MSLSPSSAPRPPSTRPPPSSTSGSARPPKPKQPVRKPQQSKNLRGRPTDPLETRLSKTLAYLLRHGAEKEGLTSMRQDGFLRVGELLSHPSLTSHLSLETLRSIVNNDRKTRYTLFYASSSSSSGSVAPDAPAPALQEAETSDASGEWWIRANQGHSLEMDAIEDGMKKVTEASQAGEAVHGTRSALWDAIYDKGLSKMERQHIHLALATPSSSAAAGPSPSASSLEAGLLQDELKKIVSGIRPSSDLYIYLDVPLLLAHDVPLFLSSNSVLLSPGDPKTPGFIGREYFLRASRKDGSVVWDRSSVQSSIAST